MTSPKLVAAMHETGHALCILALPIWEHLEHLKIYKCGGQWLGQCKLSVEIQMDAIGNVFEFAKNIAGPVAQIEVFPESVDPDLASLMRANGGLLGGLKAALQNSPSLCTNWKTDIADWLAFCTMDECVQLPFQQIEGRITRFFKDDSVRTCLQQLAHQLLDLEFLDRDALRWYQGKIPKMHPHELPSSLAAVI